MYERISLRAVNKLICSSSWLSVNGFPRHSLFLQSGGWELRFGQLHLGLTLNHDGVMKEGPVKLDELDRGIGAMRAIFGEESRSQIQQVIQGCQVGNSPSPSMFATGKD